MFTILWPVIEIEMKLYRRRYWYSFLRLECDVKKYVSKFMSALLNLLGNLHILSSSKYINTKIIIVNDHKIRREHLKYIREQDVFIIHHRTNPMTIDRWSSRSFGVPCPLHRFVRSSLVLSVKFQLIDNIIVWYW